MPPDKKKSTQDLRPKCLIRLRCVAHRPGLEPGTYGLTGGRMIGPGARNVARFRLLTVQYLWWISANLAKYPCGLPLGDRWILDRGSHFLASRRACVHLAKRCLQHSLKGITAVSSAFVFRRKCTGRWRHEPLSMA
jgi:hypothetical protein